jgi:hypothetical protein
MGEGGRVYLFINQGVQGFQGSQGSRGPRVPGVQGSRGPRVPGVQGSREIGIYNFAGAPLYINLRGFGDGGFLDTFTT